jgi:thiol-disulfide isomerase/thioredoxin
MSRILVVFFLLGIIESSLTQGINFEKGSFEEIKAKAKKENKLIFIDAYTTWCGPCKWMASTVFTNDTVGQFYNDKFLSAKIDMEKGEGIDFAKKYNVRCYPNLIILNGDGEVIHRMGGGLRPQAFINFGANALQGNKTFNYYLSNFDQNKSNTPFLLEYIEYLGHTCLPVEEPINSYFEHVEPSKYSEKENWKLIWNYSNSKDSKTFNYFIKNQKEFSAKYGQDSVDMKIVSVFQKESHKFLYSNPINENELTTYLKEIESLNISQSKNAVFSIKLDLFIKKNDWKGYENELLLNGDQLLLKNQYNAVAWNIYEKSSNQELLTKAAHWMKTLTDYQGNNSQNYAELDTYACVLYKLKQKEEALKIALRAIEKAKSMGMKESQYEETTELITKINML